MAAGEHETGGRWTDRLPTVGPVAFRRTATVNVVLMALIVLSGAAVRLSGSGLGCPDWPTCYQRRVTPQLSLHPMIEFGNRMVTVVLTVVVIAALLAALRRRPFRPDLTWLAGGLVGGVVAQAVLGGIVVYTKLNPYLVMCHFLLSMVVLADAVVLRHRCTRDYRPGRATSLVPPPVRWLSRGMVVLLAVVVAAGTATTGAGPHAGGVSSQGVAKRLPIALRDMAELHSSLALLLIGAVLAAAVCLHAIDVPERVRRAARILVLVLVAQAAVGYTQYFTHLPPVLVEVHVAGATALVIGMLQYLLALTHHPAEAAVPVPDQGRPAEPLVAEVPVGGW